MEAPSSYSVTARTDAAPIPSQSAASWAAIIAGAVAAIAASIVLLALGSGLGFAAASPWPNTGINGLTLAVAAAIWLIITQWLSAAIGGYLAGRLRTRWNATHTHEVFFRDTAHGLLTWALASVAVAVFVGSGVSGGLGIAGRVAGEAGSAAAAAAASVPASSNAYDIDRALRPSDPASSSAPAADPRPEVVRLIGNAVTNGSMSDDDRAYLAQLLAARTGVSQDEAKRRVDGLVSAAMDAQTKAKAAADKARKAAAQASLYTALAMLIGAFIACVTAVVGGRLRDEHP